MSGFSGSRLPRVSVGLPVYNGADYVAEAIDSILNQTFENFELLIQRNASTDTTSEICRAYAARDRRVRYVRTRRMSARRPTTIWSFGARGVVYRLVAPQTWIKQFMPGRCTER